MVSKKKLSFLEALKITLKINTGYYFLHMDEVEQLKKEIRSAKKNGQ